MSEMDNIELGRRLTRLRKRLNLTQSEFGLAIGVKSRTTIRTWEKGKSMASLEPKLPLIIKEWNVNPDWLHHDKGDMFTHTLGDSSREESAGLTSITQRKKPHIDIPSGKFNNEYTGLESEDLPDGYWEDIVPMDVLTLRIRDEGGALRSELCILGKIGIPAVDHNPDLLCFWYDGHEMRDIRDGSIIVVDSSKKEPLGSELYLYKYFPEPENQQQYVHIVRRLKIPKQGGGFYLVNTDGTEILRVRNLKLLLEMTVGRIRFIYARQDLARDLVLDNFRLVYSDDGGNIKTARAK